MTHIAVRAWLLWGAITLVINWWFGYNQWVRLWELVEASSPQVEAFIAGITDIGWIQLIALVVGFLRRRATYMAVKRIVAIGIYVLSSTGFRRLYNWLITQPTRYSMRLLRHLKMLRKLRRYLLFQSWFLAFYTAAILASLTFVGAELLLALVRGTLYLPPVIVRYQAEIITFVGAYFAATAAQWFIGQLWELLFWNLLVQSLPPNVHNFFYQRRIWLLRKLVWLRLWRVNLTRQFFYYRTWLLSVIVVVYSAGTAL